MSRQLQSDVKRLLKYKWAGEWDKFDRLIAHMQTQMEVYRNVEA